MGISFQATGKSVCASHFHSNVHGVPNRASLFPTPGASALISRHARHRAPRGQALVTRAEQGRAPRWDETWAYLTEQKLQTISPSDLQKKVRSGKSVLIDIRPKHRYEESHAEGAVNVELFQRVDFSKPNLVRYVRAVMHMANGVDPVEPNPSFVDEVAAAAGGKPVIMMCEIGGTLQPSVSFRTGKVSRSLLAASDVLRSGAVRGVEHARGGTYGWFKAGLPMTGEYDASGVGRTPSVVEEEIFSYGRRMESLDEAEGRTEAAKGA